VTRKSLAIFVVFPAGLAVGVLSVLIGRAHPSYWFAGVSPAYAAVELAAGAALVAAGLTAWVRRPESRFGALLVASGLGWFLVEWNNPEIPSSPAFTLALAFYVVAPALVAHAALAYPGGSVASRLEQLALAAAYAGSLLLFGLLPAFAFDPTAEGCNECPSNLLLLHDSPRLFEQLNRTAVYAGLAWSLVLVALLVRRLFRTSPALRRLSWPVVAPAAAYLALVGADFAHSLDRGYLANDAADRALWLGEAAALLALSGGVAWEWLRARRTRAAVARLVVDLAGSPEPGGFRDALARTLHDPSLTVGYPLGDGRIVGADGRQVLLEAETTPLVSGGREVAILSHRPGLLDYPGQVEEVAAAAHLALENERLQAEIKAQLEDLRESRARVITTGDAERRRLERDLHDGAQQRLVGLSLSLRLARSAHEPESDPDVLRRIGAADAELRAALAELRDLAAGIFPAVLAEDGLAAALETLADDARIPVAIAAVADERFEPEVEAAGYFVVAEVLRQRGVRALTLTAVRRDDRLVVEVASDGEVNELVDAMDRVGALDGTLEVARGGDGRATIRAEIPCGS
jgi:signal transduction histidine kinase